MKSAVVAKKLHQFQDYFEKELTEVIKRLNSFLLDEIDLTSNNQKVVKDTIQNLIVKQELPAIATNLIITTPRTSCIYFLPKIHKPNNPSRPIVSACSCLTELISSYLDNNRFITSVNSFHPALKYTWEISATSLAFLDIKVSISGNSLCTFLTSGYHRQPQKSGAKIHFSNRHP